jgi:hypothetical protein
VSNTKVTAELDEVTFVEYLAHQAHASQVVQARPVRGADAGRFLAAVL